VAKAEDLLIALDDGHGIDTSGKRTPVVTEIGRAIKENEFNSKVVKYMDEHLKYIGFKTLLVAPTDADTSLNARTNLANSKGADAYISIHFDAMGSVWGNAEGHSIFVLPGATTSKKLAECVAGFLQQGTSQKWRGIKEQNFHVLRETKMPAILSENGFMDSPREARLMLDINFQKEVAREHAQGICKYFGVTYKEKKEGGNNVANEEYEKNAKPSPSLETEYNAAVKAGITDGTYPKRPATREEVAVMILRGIKK